MQIKQLEADLEELGTLLERAERKRVQDLLKDEQQNVKKELFLKRQQKDQQVKREAEPSKAPYTVKITNYGMVLYSGPAQVVCAEVQQITFSLLFCLSHSMGPVREVCQDIPHAEGCP